MSKKYKDYTEITLDKVKPGDLLSALGKAPRRVTRKTDNYVYYRPYELPLTHGNFMVNCPQMLANIAKQLKLKGVEAYGDMWNGSGTVPIQGNEHILKLGKENRIKIHRRHRGNAYVMEDLLIREDQAEIEWDFYVN